MRWDRHYRHVWQQSRAKKWPKFDGKFDEGEVITMRKGRSNDIAGYQVWLGYDYQVEGEQVGLYTSSEFKEKDDAEAYLELLAGKQVFVRVKPNKPMRSRVLDEDLALLLPPGTKVM